MLNARCAALPRPRAPDIPALLGTRLAAAALARPCAAAVRAAREVKIEDVEESLGRDSSFKVRIEAALILGRLHQVRSVPALVGALHDSDPGVRAAAAESLGEIGSPLPREALVAALGDPEPAVRRAARTALRRLGSDEGPREPGEPDIRRHAAPDGVVRGQGDRRSRTPRRPRAAEPHARFPDRPAAPVRRRRPGRAARHVRGRRRHQVAVARDDRPRRRGELRGPAGRQPATLGRRLPADQRPGDGAEAEAAVPPSAAPEHGAGGAGGRRPRRQRRSGGQAGRDSPRGSVSRCDGRRDRRASEGPRAAGGAGRSDRRGRGRRAARPRSSRSWSRTPSTRARAASTSRSRRAGGGWCAWSTTAAGMAPDDARLALRRHATSKIAAADDLWGLRDVRVSRRGAAVDRGGLAADAGDAAARGRGAGSS